MPAVKDPETGKFVSAEVAPEAQPREQPRQQPPPKEKEEKPKPEDISGVEAFLAEGMGMPKKKEEAKKPEDKPKPAAKAPEKKVEPKKPEPKPAATPPALTAVDIARETAKAVAEVVKPKEAPKAEKPDPNAGMSAEDRRTLAIIGRMETNQPEKYKGLADKYRESHKKLEAYAEEWRKAHPGQEFKEEDSEHDTFYRDNDVDWSDSDFDEARVDLKVEEKLAKQDGQVTKKLSELERKEELRERAHLIDVEQGNAAGRFWKQSGIKDLIAPNGTLDQKVWTDAVTKDPIGAPVLLNVARALDTEVAELYKLDTGLADFNEKNKVHVNLAEFIGQEGKRVMAMPEADRINKDGQTFLPRTKYNELSEKERANYWTFSTRDIAALRAHRLAEQALAHIKAETEKLERYAAARGYKPAEANQNGTHQQQEPAKEEDETRGGKPDSPSTATQSQLAAARGKGGEPPEAATTHFLKEGLGIR